MPKKLEFSGASGATYTFEVYPKTAEIPATGGIYILTYSHPRGHLSGFQVNTLRIGEANILNQALEQLRLEEGLAKQCWNYTCIMQLDTIDVRQEYFKDLHAKNLI